jgi:hypothetical protein
MSLLDKAKKLAEEAAEKAAPLIDKAASRAPTVVDKAGQQIDRRTGGKYHDKIEAVGTKVSELAERRLAARDGAATADGFPPQPSAAATSESDPFPAPPGTAATPSTDGSPAQQPDAPAQPDLDHGQPDDPAYSGTALDPDPAARPLDDRADEPSFSAPSADVTFPAPPPATTFPAEPDSAGGRPDDPEHSPAPTGSEFPGLSEGPADTPTTSETDDRPHPTGPAMGGSGGPTP